MDERSYLDLICGRRRGCTAGMMRAGLSLLTPLYGTVVGTRSRLFDAGLWRVHRVRVPVVSVGNITTGGTGKTPVVGWLAERLREQGVRPCLVSRGYRSLEAGGNDERRVLELMCPGVPHVQDRDRVAAAREAVQNHATEVIVLDDGFQHRRLHRDLDIVLIDATNPWGYGHLLPRGLLREPRSALKRADIVGLTRADQVTGGALGQLRDDVRRYTDAPLAEVAFRPMGLVSLAGETASVDSLAGQTVLAFCGIGNPEGFRSTLETAGILLTSDSFIAFPDHHHYTQQEVRELVGRAESQGATALVTTHKDLVKLDSSWNLRLPVWAVLIRADVTSGRAELERALSGVFRETADEETG